MASIYVAPSVDLEASKQFVKKAFEVRGFFWSAFFLPSRWSREPLTMQGFELATIFVAPSDFQNFWETDPRKLVGVLGGLIEVATGHCKNAVNRAGGHLGAPL